MIFVGVSLQLFDNYESQVCIINCESLLTREVSEMILKIPTLSIIIGMKFDL